jgi:hypothetical protein
MARKNSVTAENLAALGAERLAALLIELGEADSAVRKRLVLALAERAGPAGLIKAVDRRLAALASSYGDVPWEKAKTYAGEIDGLRTAITQSLAPLDAPAAAERLVRLIGLAPAVLQRVDTPYGRFNDIFRLAVADLGAVSGMIEDRDPEMLAEATLDLLQSDAFGHCDELIEGAAPALGAPGLAALARRAAAAIAELGDKGAGQGVGRLRLYQVLSDVADARGDVDGFIAAQKARGDFVDTLGIASRLIEAGRAAEALAWLDKPDARPGLRPASQWARQILRAAALDQLGRRAEAQALRWRLFEQSLDRDLLRAYLRALPDFEDDAALEQAFALAAGYPNALSALAFLAGWPNLAAAATLVFQRVGELDGRDYPLLEAAADSLSDAQPLAAALIRRRMIDSVLDRAASNAYAHAAKNLAACKALDGEINWKASSWLSHDGYLADLRARHGRKQGFWSLVRS